MRKLEEVEKNAWNGILFSLGTQAPSRISLKRKMKHGGSLGYG
jgi:hypothetical protein